jgi:hypothetical protein
MITGRNKNITEMLSACTHIKGKLDKTGTMFALKKLFGLSPQANYTDRASAACQRSYCQLFCG